MNQKIKGKSRLLISMHESFIGYELEYIDFLHYQPSVYDKEIAIRNPDLKTVLELDYDDDSMNLARTDEDEVREFVLAYLQEHPDILKKYGISSIENLSVSDAAKVACQIVVDRMKYDNETNLIEYAKEGEGQGFSTHEGIVYLKNTTPALLPPEKFRKVGERLLATQNMPIEDLLSHWRKGVCRHYARAYVAVFNVLKLLNRTTNLLNTYVIVTGNREHAFNTIISVSGDDRLNLTVVDPTSADINELYEGDAIQQTVEHALGLDEFDSTLELVRDAHSSLYLSLYRAALRRSTGFFSRVDKKYIRGLKSVAKGILE